MEISKRDLCPVCHGNRTDTECILCGTPHHEECWRSVDGCSVYGCGSKHTADDLAGFQETYARGLAASLPAFARGPSFAHIAAAWFFAAAITLVIIIFVGAVELANLASANQRLVDYSDVDLVEEVPATPDYLNRLLVRNTQAGLFVDIRNDKLIFFDGKELVSFPRTEIDLYALHVKVDSVPTNGEMSDVAHCSQD